MELGTHRCTRPALRGTRPARRIAVSGCRDWSDGSPFPPVPTLASREHALGRVTAMSTSPSSASAHGVPEEAYAAEVWEDESPATADAGGEEDPAEAS